MRGLLQTIEGCHASRNLLYPAKDPQAEAGRLTSDGERTLTTTKTKLHQCKCSRTHPSRANTPYNENQILLTPALSEQRLSPSTCGPPCPRFPD